VNTKTQTKLAVDQLPDRIMPTVAAFSNGVLFVQGDNLGNDIHVGSTNGNLTVTDHGAAVAIGGTTTATTTNTLLVVEAAGTGKNNTLTTDASLGAVADSLIGGGTGTMTFSPLNNAPSVAYGSSNADAKNVFNDNPGGKDVFIGGAGKNVFFWAPGTGSDKYVGAGKSNTVIVVGNANAKAENDSLTADGTGGVVYSRNNLVPFKLFATGIQDWVIQPSTAAGNTVTIGDLSGTGTKQVEVDETQSTVDASTQNDPAVKLIVRGKRNTVSEGAGATALSNTNVPLRTHA
jgi:hypothetical protein